MHDKPGPHAPNLPETKGGPKSWYSQAFEKPGQAQALHMQA